MKNKKPTDLVGDLFVVLRDLVAEYEGFWNEATDGEYGKPNSPAYVRALDLLARFRKLQQAAATPS